jgi:hypothetical protein
MIQLHKRIPVLTLGITISCSIFFNSCSKDDDPQADHPNLLLQENFDSPENATWKPGDSGAAATLIRNGWCVMSYTSDDYGTYNKWATENIFPAGLQTGSVEILMRHTAGHEYDKAGLLFWLNDQQNYVAFTIGDKDYRIYQVMSGQATNLVDWTPSGAIRGQLNEDNKLKVTLTDTKLVFHINDQKVIEMSRGAMTTLDKVGFQLYKASTTTNKSSYEIDYITAMRQ